MAHVNRSTSIAPKFNTWNKHLRPDGKRNTSKRERNAAKRQIKREMDSAHNPNDYLDFIDDPIWKD